MPVFYRIVRTDPPTEADFVSDRERNRPRPADPAVDRLMDGFSAFATEAQARRMGRRLPIPGRFIAVVEVAETQGSASIQYERTLETAGHYTLWGDPAAILERVSSVIPV